MCSFRWVLNGLVVLCVCIQIFSILMDEYWSYIKSYAQITNRLIWVNNRSTDKKYGE
jgi:hypothetical protein